MPGLIGKKLGMTNIFTADRKAVACTLVETGPCVVTQIKTSDKDGYKAVQIGFDDKKDKHTTRPEKGHYAKAGVTTAKRILREFDFNPDDFKPGDILTADMFAEGEFVDVIGISKGKGFQGVVKRHGFAGVGGRTHGQHNRQRAPGSVGACSYPARVFKGKKLPGRMGTDRVKMQNLKVLKVIADKNLLVISGAIPGSKGSYLMIEK